MSSSNDNPRRYAIYARVSSGGQDVDLSITAQVEAMEEYAQQHDGVVARSYVDEAESGGTDGRPQFEQMIADALQEDSPFDEILVWKFSKFARNRRDAVVYKEVLRKRGIRVTAVKEHADDAPAGGLTEGIVELLDEFFARNLSEDIIRGMRKAASRGYWVSGWAPIGYRREHVVDNEGKRRVRLALDPPKDAMVERMFEMAAAGMSPCDIARTLGDAEWSTSSVRKVLANEAYVGVVVWGRASKDECEPVRAENAHPAIVSRELFDQAGTQGGC